MVLLKKTYGRHIDAFGISILECLYFRFNDRHLGFATSAYVGNFLLSALELVILKDTVVALEFGFYQVYKLSYTYFP